jgi:hypothetical protein
MNSRFENKVYDRDFISSEKWKKTSVELRETYLGNNIRFYIDTRTPIDIPFLIFILNNLLITPLSNRNDTSIIKKTSTYIGKKEEIETEINILNKIISQNIDKNYLSHSKKLSEFSEKILNEILEKYIPNEK